MSEKRVEKGVYFRINRQKEPEYLMRYDGQFFPGYKTQEEAAAAYARMAKEEAERATPRRSEKPKKEEQDTRPMEVQLAEKRAKELDKLRVPYDNSDPWTERPEFGPKMTQEQRDDRTCRACRWSMNASPDSRYKMCGYSLNEKNSARTALNLKRTGKTLPLIYGEYCPEFMRKHKKVKK